MKNILRGIVLFTILTATLSSCMCYGPGYGRGSRGGYGGGPRFGNGHHGGGHQGGGAYHGGRRHQGHYRR